MCNINHVSDGEFLAVAMVGLNLIGKLMESELRANNHQSQPDVLMVATQAYQQGKITKEQYFAVITALDEKTAPIYQRAYVDRDFPSIVKLRRN